MPKKSSSRRWLQEHFADSYVKKAHADGLRSRAVFKLEELQTRDKLFKKGMCVVDLGAAPGSWSVKLAQWVGPEGCVIAVDCLTMQPIPNVQFIEGDFTQEAVYNELIQMVGDKAVAWVVSDMAPNLSGIESVDQIRSISLAELALEFANKVLRKDGGFLVKTFQGAGFDEFLRNVRQYFKQVVIRKPKASRSRSREVYLVARGRKVNDLG